MPTYERTDSFKRDYKSLSADERVAFRGAVDDFVADLTAIENGVPGASFRGALRVKPMQANPGIWEMTWAGDGRATFDMTSSTVATVGGAPMRHVVWRRIGTHAIFGNP